jgi:4-hydroxy-3-methylbut-2-enyl diphosphate reductase
MLADNYHSDLVDRVKAEDFTFRAGRLTLHLAASSGSATAWTARSTTRIRPANGFRIATSSSPARSSTTRTSTRNCARWACGSERRSDAIDRLGASDVVILPAFGVTVAMLERLDRADARSSIPPAARCQRLEERAPLRRARYTSIIHGKVWHEETQATASQAVQYGGKALVVFDHAETDRVHYIRRGPLPAICRSSSPTRSPRLRLRARPRAHRSREPDDDADVRVARNRRDDPDGDARTIRRADPARTIRRSIQSAAPPDRQDAVVALLRDRAVDVVIVIGGYNSNTTNLAASAPPRPTFHIADPDCLLSDREIRHRPVGSKQEVTSTEWLPSDGPVRIGLTSGASTPRCDNLVGADHRQTRIGPSVLQRICTPPPRRVNHARNIGRISSGPLLYDVKRCL